MDAVTLRLRKLSNIISADAGDERQENARGCAVGVHADAGVHAHPAMRLRSSPYAHDGDVHPLDGGYARGCAAVPHACAGVDGLRSNAAIRLRTLIRRLSRVAM